MLSRLLVARSAVHALQRRDWFTGDSVSAGLAHWGFLVNKLLQSESYSARFALDVAGTKGVFFAKEFTGKITVKNNSVLLADDSGVEWRDGNRANHTLPIEQVAAVDFSQRNPHRAIGVIEDEEKTFARRAAH